jgi:hypothetical protein
MRSRSRVILVSAVALACACLSFAATGFAAAPTPAQIEILSPETIEVPADKEEHEDVLVRNAGGTPVVVGFEVNGEYAPTITPVSGEVLAYSVRRLTLNFTPTNKAKEVSGELIAYGEGVAPAGIPFTSSLKAETPWWIYVILFGSLAVAIALMVVRWLVGEFPRKATLGGRIGPANWEFTKSWGSNLTVVGALLGTILLASVLPEESVVPKVTYAGLNLFFGILIVIAPFIYTATQSAAAYDDSQAGKEPQLQGYVWSFLLATAITVWAVLGEIGTMFAIFDEIRVGQTMPDAAIAVLALVLALSAVLLLVMSWKRVKAIVEYQWTRKEQIKKGLTTDEATFGVASVEPALPAWTVL